MTAAAPTRRLTVVIAADVASFQRGLHVAQKTLESTSRSMIAIGQNLAFSLGLPLAGIGASAVKMAADFETAATRIVTQTNISRKEVEALGVEAGKLSDHLGTDKIQLMTASLAIAGAGMRDAATVMDILGKTAKASAIGLGDQETIARAVTSIMIAFANQHVDATRAINSFVLAVKEGGFPAAQWADSIGMIGSFAASMGVSLEQVTAGISAYSRVTGNAQEATIGFRNILSDILSPARQASNVWDDLFDTKRGEGILELRRMLQTDLVGALKAVADALFKLPVEQAAALADRLFDNVRGAVAFLSVFQANDEVVAIFNRMVEAADPLNEAWNEWITSFDHVQTIVRGMMKNLATEMGDELLPTIKEVGFQFGGWLRAIRPIVVENAKLIAQVGLMTVGFIAATTALGVFGLMIATIWRTINAVIFAIAGLGRVLIALGPLLLGPWGLAIAAVAAFVAALVMTGDKTTDTARASAGTWTKVWEIAWVVMKIGFHNVIMFIQRQLAELLDWLAGWVRSFSEEFLFVEPVASFLDQAAAGVRASLEKWQKDLDDLEKEAATKTEDLLGLKALQSQVDEFIKEWKTPEEIIKSFHAKLSKGAAGFKVGEVSPPVDEKAIKKQLEALEKVRDLFREQSIELSALEANWSDFEKTTREGIAAINEAGREGLLSPKALEQLGDAYAKLRGEIEKRINLREGIPQLAEIVREQAIQLGELASRWDAFEIETARGLREIDAIASRLRLPVDEVERYRQAYINLRNEIEKQNRAIVIDIQSSLVGAIEQVTRGLLQGTQDWRNILEIFSDVGLSIFFDLFRQIIEKKLDLDAIVLPNFGKTIPEAVQKTVDDIQKVSEVLGELSDQALAEIVIGAELEELEQLSRARDEILKTVEDAKVLEGTFRSVGDAAAAISASGPLIRQRPGRAPDLGGAPVVTSEPVPVDVVRVNESILDQIQDFFALIRDGLSEVVIAVWDGLGDLGRLIQSAFDQLTLVADQILGHVFNMATLDKRERKMAIVSAIGSIAGAALSTQTGGAGGGPGGAGGGTIEAQFGGIVRRRQRVLVGEAGPEAIVPLSKLSDFLEPAGETNVVVNSPHPATVRDQKINEQRVIEVIIDDAVARSLRVGGKASSALERLYGVRRVGGSR